MPLWHLTSLLADVVHVKEDGILGCVQNGVGMLVQVSERQRRSASTLSSVRRHLKGDLVRGQEDAGGERRSKTTRAIGYLSTQGLES